jgi:hypothetical protein
MKVSVFLSLEAFPKLQFWESCLGFMWKKRTLGRFFQKPGPKPCAFSAQSISFGTGSLFFPFLVATFFWVESSRS